MFDKFVGVSGGKHVTLYNCCLQNFSVLLKSSLIMVMFGHYDGQVFKAICVQLLPSVIGLRQSTLVSPGPLLLKLDTLLCSLFGRYDMRVCGLKKLAKLNLKI